MRQGYGRADRRGLLALIKSFRQRIDQMHGAIIDGSEHLVPISDKLRSGSGRERFRGPGGRLGRKRSTIAGPGLQPTVKNSRGVESDPPQHPPNAGSPSRKIAVVKHDLGIVADPQSAHGGAELFRCRHGERKRAVAVAEIAGEIGKAGIRNVSAIVVCTTADIPEATVIINFRADHAVEHHKIRIIEMLAQPIGRHECIHDVFKISELNGSEQVERSGFRYLA